MLSDKTNLYFQLAQRFVEQTNQHVFLSGKAGTGKTTFLKFIKERRIKKMAVVAPTGVAAINAGGVTMHSFFQLPFAPFLPPASGGPLDLAGAATEHSLFKNIRFNRAKRELLNELELLVIDEVSMLRSDTLDAIDCILRQFRQQPLFPFGGVQMLYIGDLFQLPPVVHHLEWEILRPHYRSAFFFDAQVLRHATPLIVELKKIYRQNEAGFIQILNSVRNNQVTEGDLQMLHRRYFPGFEPAKEENYITLTTHNARADAINQQQLTKLPGKLFEFKGTIQGDFSEKAFPAEKTLFLKTGSQIMFVKNDKGESRRFYNGKIATISQIKGEEIKVSFPGEKLEMVLERETWRNIRYIYNRQKDRVEEEELGTFTQYPVRLAWAITIHKSQGLTFNKAIVDAGASFSPGQVYVALSRLTSLDGMILCSRILPSSIQTDERVLAFAKTEMSENILKDLLIREQLLFVGQSISQCFNWSKLAERFRDHVETSAPLKATGNINLSDLNRKLLSSILAQQEISEKFTREIEQLWMAAEREGFNRLHNRVFAARGYFDRAIDEQLLLIQQHMEPLRIKTNAKKFQDDLAELKMLMQRKKTELFQGLRLAEGLMNGSDLVDLLQIAEQKDSLRGESELPVLEATAPASGRNSQTLKITLELFRQKKTVEQIAELRRMAKSTIEKHLTVLVSTGELEVGQIVPSHKLNQLMRVVDRLGPESLKNIKEQLGADYSYTEVRAGVSHWQMRNQSLTNHPGRGRGEKGQGAQVA
jgi:hypothetical protein